MYIHKIYTHKIWYFVFSLLSKFTWCLLLICLLLGANQAFAISDFYKNKAEGWFWYKDPVKEKYEEEERARTQEDQTKLEKKEIKGSKMQVPKNLTPESARAFKEKFQRKLDDAKNMWLFSGDFKHAAEYLRMQKRVMDFASQGARVAATAKRIYPDLNDEILNPTSQTARSLFEEQKKQLEDKMITEYAKEFHLVYFTDPESQACQIFAKTLAEFSALYGFKVFAQEVSTKDSTIKPMGSMGHQKGKRLFETINDQVLLASVAPQHLPALVAVDPETKEWQPIAYHMPNFYELRKLVLETIKDIISKMNARIERERRTQ